MEAEGATRNQCYNFVSEYDEETSELEEDGKAIASKIFGLGMFKDLQMVLFLLRPGPILADIWSFSRLGSTYYKGWLPTVTECYCLLARI